VKRASAFTASHFRASPIVSAIQRLADTIQEKSIPEQRLAACSGIQIQTGPQVESELEALHFLDRASVLEQVRKSGNRFFEKTCVKTKG
jgi:hypothetical protein